MLNNTNSPARAKVIHFLKEALLFLGDILSNAIVIIILVIIIRSFVVSPFRVIGSSMADTLHSKEFIIVNKIGYLLSEPKREDIVVFLPPVTNKYDPKFEPSASTDDLGKLTLDISTLRKPKDIFYCKVPLISRLWFCQERVRAKDWIYYQKIDPANPYNLVLSRKTTVKEEEVDEQAIHFTGDPKTSYKISIFNVAGPEYFIKRIIGVPGDTIKIDGGKVFLKEKTQDDFKELEEDYLNPENRDRTYIFGEDSARTNIFTVPEGAYFAMGDNRNYSNDARSWVFPIDRQPNSFVHQDQISGKAMVVLWPPQALRRIKH